MAGATAVGIGSAACDGGIEVFGRIAAEMAQWMTANGISEVKELTGAAHR